MLTPNKLSLLKDAAGLVLSISILANSFDGSFSVYKAEAASETNQIVVCPLLNESMQIISSEAGLAEFIANNDLSVFEDENTVLSYVTQVNLSMDELSEIVMSKASADKYYKELNSAKEAQLIIAVETAEKARYEASLVKNPNMTIKLTYDELDLLERLTECEAGDQDDIGKILVVNTIINRINSPKFPNNITDVIYAPGQYSPIMFGIVDDMVAQESTKEAVRRALEGEDYSQNAYYFMDRRYSDPSCIVWFDTLPKVVEHMCHEFFTEY